MRNCPKCGEKISFKARTKSCFGKEKKLVCYNCNSQFKQSVICGQISYLISSVIYLAVVHPISVALRRYIERNFIVLSIIAIIGIVWIIGIEYLSQFWSKYKEIE